MAILLNKSLIRSVGLSEVSEKTLRCAHACLLEATDGQHGISALQTEYSLASRAVEFNGVLDACAELNVTFVAYSPISRGLLSGELTSLDNLDENDFRRNLPRFSQENLHHNNRLTETVSRIAISKGCTPAQLSIAWIMHHKPTIVPIPGTKRIEYLQQNIAASEVTLTDKEYFLLNKLSKEFAIQGQRYTPEAMKSYDLAE